MAIVNNYEGVCFHMTGAPYMRVGISSGPARHPQVLKTGDYGIVMVQCGYEGRTVVLEFKGPPPRIQGG